MTGSLLVQIVIGLAIFLGTTAFQNEKLNNLAPSFSDFSRTAAFCRFYWYKEYGTNIVTQIYNKVIYCSLNYSDGNASCFVALKHVPPNSRITIS
jgi:hypothetical protein